MQTGGKWFYASMCVFVYVCNLQKAERCVILQQMVALQGSPAQSQAEHPSLAGNRVV